MEASRKYSLACYILAVGTTGLALDWLSGGEFVAICSLTLGLYGAANVTDKKFGGRG